MSGNSRCENNWDDNWRREDHRDERGQSEMRHVHEVQGSTEIAERAEDPHNHRFATVTGQAIRTGESHVHRVFFRTDFYENHFHEFSGVTGRAIPVGDRHVHFLESVTTVNDGHRHRFRFATLIEDPIGEEEGRNPRREETRILGEEESRILGEEESRILREEELRY